jgi:signal transduction histidine kinase
MIRHLYLRIYLASLAALVSVVVLCALLWRWIAGRSDGRVLLERMHSDALHLHFDGIAIIIGIATLVALAMYPVARRLTRQLENLSASVARFGNGDLAARADVAGHDEVARLAGSFNATADHVSRLLEAHRRLLMNASHELRSPLARIRMALALHEAEPNPALLRSMEKDCSEIDEQIEEILLASKLETTDTTLPEGSIDLSVIVAEESARLGIAFDVVSLDVHGDARLLRRLTRNLLENALKHGGTDGTAALFEDSAGNRVMQVGDRGPGIPEAERERIFEPFYRPERSSETGNGWGLGLSLVKQISDLHGGSVRCLPRPGGGCLFELVLPPPSRAA